MPPEDLYTSLHLCAKVIAVGEGAEDDFAVGDRVFGNSFSGGLAPFALLQAASAFKVRSDNFE